MVKIADGQIAGSAELRKVADPASTLFKPETYFAETSCLRPGAIYVSRDTSFYVGKGILRCPTL